ncbi:MAG: putative small lipoprotein YifL [Rickettsiales bacterium]|jgi:predicted small lipoprotein YifL
MKKLFFIVLLSAISLVSCGKKGALYLPKESLSQDQQVNDEEK